MGKQRVAQIMTIAILVAALGVAAWRKGAWRPAASIAQTGQKESTPQDAIYAMLDAARSGNTAAYLAAYTAGMQASLRQAIAEQGETAFARDLRESNASIKGIAVAEAQPVTSSEVKLKVEYVYQDRNEVQEMYLERSANGWKISRAEAAVRIKTLVPYGTPVQ